VEAEVSKRLELLQKLREAPTWPGVEASLIGSLGIYAGGRGIYFHKDRTEKLVPGGIAVSVLHTGKHYPDDVSEECAIYHYPKTATPGRDAAEINAVKNSMAFGVPIFFISPAQQGARFRTVKLAWVASFDDATRCFLLDFVSSKPLDQVVPPSSHPFDLFEPKMKEQRIVSAKKRSAEFRFKVLRAYKGRCVLTGIDVQEVLDAAHIVPVERDGIDDPRNAILICANAHRAFDANLWAIHPKTLEVVTRSSGPTSQELRLTHLNLSGERFLPHRDALEWRFDKFMEREPA